MIVKLHKNTSLKDLTETRKQAIIATVEQKNGCLLWQKGYKNYKQISATKEYLQMSNKFQDFLERTKKIRRNLIAIAIVVAVCMSSVAATASIAYKVDVIVDGESNLITTLRSTVDTILEQVDVELDENDIIDLSGFTPWQDSKIVITSNSEVTIVDGENKPVKVLASGTVADALKKAGITVQNEDKMNFAADSKLAEGMKIEITRAFTITIVSGDEVKTIKTTGGTVADALKQANIEITEQQKLNHKLTATLRPYGTIEIFEVNTRQRVEVESIPYETTKKYTDSLEKGVTKVYKKGAEGQKKCRYIDTYENNEIVSTELVLERVVKEPVDEIVLIGTKEAPKKVTTTKKATTKKPTTSKKNDKATTKKPDINAKPSTTLAGGIKYAKNVKATSELKVPENLKLNSKNIPVNYKKKFTGKATAYNARVGALTASGRKVKPGHVAVDPREIPYGSELWIVGPNGYVYGYSVAADTGGFVYSTNYLVDLFFWTYKEACNWGLRDVTIYVL